MGELVRYDQACQALAEAKSVDEAKDLRNKSEAMRAYARQANNKQLEVDAAEIRLRAERRLGELIQAQKETVGLNTGTRGQLKGRDSSGGAQAEPPDNAPPTLSEAGINKKLSSRAQKLAAVPEDEFEGMLGDWRDRVSEEGQRVTTNLVKAGEKEIRKKAKSAVLENTPDDLPPINQRYRLIQSELGDAGIEPGSIDCIVTDPPYPEKYLDTFGALARCAGEWLKPGGSLLVMSGQFWLPEVMAQLRSDDRLSYQWTLAYMTPGGQAVQVWPRKVNTFWKPVIWLVKGEFDGYWMSDVARSDVNDNDKRFHHWGQSESGIKQLIERVSVPGDVVLDPFCGGGTTGVVSVQTSRRFVGIDCDENAINETRKRLEAISDAATLVA